MDSYREKMIELNRREYGLTYGMFKWLDEEGAQKASEKREEIRSRLPKAVQSGFNGTKIYSGELSPGCLLCGQGGWSCLFINSVCNARCFYCPTAQTSESEPATNGVSFSDPQDYSDYIHRFNIRGVGISGGEPFLTFDRTLSFVRKIKERFGESVYLWLYTNGRKADQQGLGELKNAGLDEIRFDLSANGYALDKVRLAASILGRVTVEVPSIPEDFELLKTILRELNTCGVKHLNLHHLRSTPFNCRSLIERDYTFLHGKQVTVLESELLALELIRYERENRIGLPIHYCSYVFKNQYQAAGHRKRIAPFVCEPYEDITSVGLIRRIKILGERERLQNTVEVFVRNGAADKRWLLKDDEGALTFNSSLLPHVDLGYFSLFLSYDVPILRSQTGRENSSKEFSLNEKMRLILGRAPVLREKEVKGAALRNFVEFHVAKSGDAQTAEAISGILGRDCEDICELEAIRPGLQEYS